LLLDFFVFFVSLFVEKRSHTVPTLFSLNLDLSDRLSFLTMYTSFSTATILLVALIASVFVVQDTTATSAGAGGCALGAPAVGGPHLASATQTTGTLDDFGIQITIDGEVIEDGDDVELTAGESYDIVVTATGDAFKGVLINTDYPVPAANSPDVFLTPLENTQEAFACTQAGVLGVTHFNPDPKTSASGVLNPTIPGTYIIGVTNVITLQPSEYYFSSFQLEVVEAEGGDEPGAPNATAPVAAPTAETVAPVAAPAAPASPTVPMGNETAPVAAPVVSTVLLSGILLFCV
jgi:hypothetical protein